MARALNRLLTHKWLIKQSRGPLTQRPRLCARCLIERLLRGLRRWLVALGRRQSLVLILHMGPVQAILLRGRLLSLRLRPRGCGTLRLGTLRW